MDCHDYTRTELRLASLRAIAKVARIPARRPLGRWTSTGRVLAFDDRRGNRDACATSRQIVGPSPRIRPVIDLHLTRCVEAIRVHPQERQPALPLLHRRDVERSREAPRAQRGDLSIHRVRQTVAHRCRTGVQRRTPRARVRAISEIRVGRGIREATPSVMSMRKALTSGLPKPKVSPMSPEWKSRQLVTMPI